MFFFEKSDLWEIGEFVFFVGNFGFIFIDFMLWFIVIVYLNKMLCLGGYLSKIGF